MYHNNLTKVKFIYLDGGNVLVKRNSVDGDHIAEELGFDPLDYEKIVEAVATAQPQEEIAKYSHMKTLDEEYAALNRFHVRMCQYLGKTYNNDLIIKLSNFRIKADFSLKDGVPEALKRLSSTYKLGVLSNAPPSRRHFELKLQNIDRYFDTIILSAEEGLSKSQIEMFKIAIDRSKTPAENILFIDDKEKYLKNARTAGIENLILMNTNEEKSEEFDSISGLLELCSKLGV